MPYLPSQHWSPPPPPLEAGGSLTNASRSCARERELVPQEDSAGLGVSNSKLANKGPTTPLAPAGQGASASIEN
jgi:hypothetical protein